MPPETESPSRREVRRLTVAGVEPRAISAMLGISTQAVYKHLKKLGLEPARRNGHGAA